MSDHYIKYTERIVNYNGTLYKFRCPACGIDAVTEFPYYYSRYYCYNCGATISPAGNGTARAEYNGGSQVYDSGRQNHRLSTEPNDNDNRDPNREPAQARGSGSTGTGTGLADAIITIINGIDNRSDRLTAYSLALTLWQHLAVSLARRNATTDRSE